MKATLFGLAAILGLGLAVSAPDTAQATGWYGSYGYHYGYHPYYPRYYKKRWVKRHYYPYHYSYYHRPYHHYW
jgi:hypothetical protein